MSRLEWLALFVALEGAPDGLDPVRIQKGMFLFAMEGPAPQDEKYLFRPYDYGPMSPAIYEDLDVLVLQGLVDAESVPGKRWSVYRATEHGLRAGREALTRAAANGQMAAVAALYEVKHRVAALPFNQLFDDVYDEYPEYAVNSVFRRVS